MPSISACDYTHTKTLDSLAVSVTYARIPGNSQELDCIVTFKNTSPKPRERHSEQLSNDMFESANSNGQDKERRASGQETSESNQLKTASSDVSLFLGYIQLVGYVRLNNDFNATGTPRDTFWKNLEYASKYPIENEHDKVEGILLTPFFNQHDALRSDKNKLAGWPDLKNCLADTTSLHLLHDLAHIFNGEEPPVARQSAISNQEFNFLTSEFPLSIVPFFVTLQHLLFSSTKIRPEEAESHKLRFQIPKNSLPPSYNTGLTGFLGENGLISICYLFVVGILEEGFSGMHSKSIYFPFHFIPALVRTERGWSQPDYLRKPEVYKDWLPRSDSKLNTTLNGKPHKETDKENTSAARNKLVFELDNLVNSSVETVAAKERRKSSVSIMRKEEHGCILQIPTKTRVSYQIKANDQILCTALMSKTVYHVGEDIHYCLDLPCTRSLSTRVVGAVAHIEAHEVFHISELRKMVNIYKVTPAIKMNTYATALGISSKNDASISVSNVINLPSSLTQQFQASSLMDLKYILKFALVLNEFDEESQISSIDQLDEKAVVDYLQAYKSECDFHKFDFSIPLTVLPLSVSPTA